MRMSIRTKMGFVVIIIGLCAVVGWIGLSAVDRIYVNLDDTYRNRMLPVEYASGIRDGVQTARVRTICQVCHPGINANAPAHIRDIEATIAANIEKLERTDLADEGKALLGRIQTAWADYKDNRDRVFALSLGGQQEKAKKELMATEEEKFRPVAAALAELDAMNEKQAEVARRASQATYDEARIMILSLVSLAVLLGGALGLFLANSISRSARAMSRSAEDIRNDLDRLADGIGAVAKGDLTRRVDVQSDRIANISNDEIGDATRSFNMMVDRLHDTAASFGKMILGLGDVVGHVLQSANAVSQSSAALSQSAKEASEAAAQGVAAVERIAQGASQQAQALKESSSALDQLGDGIKQIARGAQEQAISVTRMSAMMSSLGEEIVHVTAGVESVASAANQASSAARNGAATVAKAIDDIRAINDVVGEVAAKIKELGDRSMEIGNIVRTIDDISERTNLLALNAAIEAARAGEQGRGFAVVASEVRKLAELSSKATKEIAELIGSVQCDTAEAVKAIDIGLNQVESGSRLSADAGRALEEILRAIELTDVEIIGIKTAAEKMQALSEEVTRAAEDVSAVVEENSAATAQMAITSSQVMKSIEGVVYIAEQNDAGAERASQLMREMDRQVAEVVNAAQVLLNMADALRGAVGHFGLGEPGSGDRSPSLPNGYDRRKEETGGGRDCVGIGERLTCAAGASKAS